MEDILETKTTDALADLLDAYCREYELPYASADDLLISILQRVSTLSEHGHWLMAFIRQWEIVQAQEDFESACAARGER